MRNIVSSPYNKNHILFDLCVLHPSLEKYFRVAVEYMVESEMARISLGLVPSSVNHDTYVIDCY